MTPIRPYLIVREPVEVKARNPFEAAQAAREEFPELEEQTVAVVAASLVREHDGRRWWK